MKKILLTLFVFGFLIAPMLSFAVTPSATEPPVRGVLTTIESVVNWSFGILLFLSAFFIIIGGFYYVTAGGDTGKIGTGKNYLIYALIGIAIAFLARGLVEFVVTKVVI